MAPALPAELSFAAEQAVEKIQAFRRGEATAFAAEQAVEKKRNQGRDEKSAFAAEQAVEKLLDGR